MECAKARAFMCPEIDDELQISDSAQLQEHLSSCSTCGREWEALISVKKATRAVAERIAVPQELHEKLIDALRKNGHRKSGVVVPIRKTLILSGTVAALASFFFIAIFTFKAVDLHQDSAESLVMETSDGSPSQSSGHFKHLAQVDYGRKANIVRTADAKYEIAKIGALKVAALDMFEDSRGRRILRACYQDSVDHSFCIDCYQAPAGLLTFNGSEIALKSGKKAKFKYVGNHNVVVVNKNGIDYVFATPLSKSRFLALLGESS